MLDVFISYKREDFETAKRLHNRLRSLGLGAWYDQDLKGKDLWRLEIAQNLARAKIVIALWSPEATKSTFVLAEAAQADSREALLSVIIERCEVPYPFNFGSPIDLTNWREHENDWPFWQLVEALSERLSDAKLREFTLLKQYEISKGSSNHGPVKSIEFFDYAEMMRQCEAVRDIVREFDPDVIISPDQKSGLWAEMLFDWLQRRVPVVVGYSGTRLLNGYLSVGNYFLPTSVGRIDKSHKVLFVRDRTIDFSQERLIDQYFQSKIGLHPENLCFIALASTGNSESLGDRRFHVGRTVNAEEISIFYDIT